MSEIFDFPENEGAPLWIPLPTISRMELIVNGKRENVVYFEPGQTAAALQDGNRTLKIFITKEEQ